MGFGKPVVEKNQISTKKSHVVWAFFLTLTIAQVKNNEEKKSQNQKWPRDDSKNVEDDFRMTQKTLRLICDDSEMTLKWPSDDPKMTLIWLLRWLSDYSKMTLEWVSDEF